MNSDSVLPTVATIDDRRWQLPSFMVEEFTGKQRAYCVVIPVINEGERIHRQLQSMQVQAIAQVADIIIADGGSTDGSLDRHLLESWQVRTVLVKIGAGKLSAQLRMAYAYALRQGYEGIITVDGNGKDGVEAIPNFIKELQDGYDFIQGSRFVSGGEAINTPIYRLAAIRLMHAPLISLAARHWFTDTTNGFRGYSRAFLLDQRVQPFRAVFDTYELLAYLSVRAPRLRYKTKEIPVRRAYPAGGKIPTKINSHGYLTLVQILWKTLLGRYNPSD